MLVIACGQKMSKTTHKRFYSKEETLKLVLGDDLDELNSPEFQSDSESDSDGISPSTAVPDELDKDEDVGEDFNNSFEQCCKKRKLLTAQKLVKSIESCLDEDNFDPVELPGHEKVLTAYLEKPKRKNDPGLQIKWTSQPPAPGGRQNRLDVIRGSVGVKKNAKRAMEPKECWKLFFTEQMISAIVKHTNEKISSLRKNMPPEVLSDSRNCYFGETTSQEITAWIGLIYLRGLLSQNNHSTETLFNDKTGHPVFSATMGKNRFKFLMANVRFDDEDTRPERWNQDRFAAFRELFEMFNTQCARAVTPDDYLSLDETLYPMRNQVSFKQFNPAKYGLLFKPINAARYPFTFHVTAYSGKPVGE